jgi:MFS family permease
VPIRYVRALAPELPRAVWLVQGGALINAIGTGSVAPFLLIYLHNVRGFTLGTAGLVVGVLGAAGIVVSLPTGALADRLTPRTALIVALCIVVAGYALFPLVREPWHAFVVAAIAGTGDGALRPGLLAVLASLTPRAQRPGAFALRRMTTNVGIGLGAAIGGLIATTDTPSTFTVLFLVNAVTSVVFALALVRVPAAKEAALVARRVTAALRDRPFLGLNAVNLVIHVGGFGQLAVVPLYAKNYAEISERGIGLIFLVNTLVIVVAQLPLTRALAGRRRMHSLMLVGAAWAGSWLLVLGGGTFLSGASATLLFASGLGLFGIGQCIFATVMNPLAADMAPADLLGRYLGVISLSAQGGHTLGPSLGALALTASPSLAWGGAAATCVAAGLMALALDRTLPKAARLAPRSARLVART